MISRSEPVLEHGDIITVPNLKTLSRFVQDNFRFVSFVTH
jgi:hypothetical protein